MAFTQGFFDSETLQSSSVTGLRDIVFAERMTILGDSFADGFSTFWNQSFANGGSATTTLGEGQFKTSVAINGTSQFASTNISYYPGQINWLNSAVRFGDTGTAGNIRRVGMSTVSAFVPQDGFYYELNGIVLNAVYVKSGVVTAIPSTSWSNVTAAPFILDTNYHSFEIRYTSNSVWFIIDNVLRHKVSGQTTPLTGTLSFPIFIQNIKTSGTTDITLAIRNVGNGRFGKPGGVVYETGYGAVEANAVGGGTPNGSIDTGNPLKIGGRAQSTPPSATADGNRVNAWFNPNGALNVNLPNSLPIGTNTIGKVGIDQSIPGTTNAVLLTNANIAVTGTFFQTTQPVSIATMPTTPVTGTFFQATQPVSLATNTPTIAAGTSVIGKVGIDQTTDGTTNAVRLLAETTKVIGTVNIATAQTIATVTTVSAVTAITNALPIGANTIGAVTNTNLDVALSTRLKPADTLAAVTIVGSVTSITNALPTGANTIGAVTNTNLDVALSTRLKPADTLAAVTTLGTITNALPIGANVIGKTSIDQTTDGTTNKVQSFQQAIIKGTQGTLGVTTQDLKDAGRNQVHFYTIIPVLTTATDTLQSLTGTKAGATILATTTPAVVTTGKTFRITRMAATYIATAVSGYGIVKLRFQPGGIATITSPVAALLIVGSGAPTTANSTASEEATLDEGWEFSAGTGVGISVQGFAAATATAVGYVIVSTTGYEY